MNINIKAYDKSVIRSTHAFDTDQLVISHIPAKLTNLQIIITFKHGAHN